MIANIHSTSILGDAHYINILSIANLSSFLKVRVQIVRVNSVLALALALTLPLALASVGALL